MRPVHIFPVLIASMLAGVLGCADAQEERGPLENPSLDFFIEPDELATLENRAFDGDKMAAARIVRYFGGYKHDAAKEKLWLQIASENGDARSEYELAARLLLRVPPRDSQTLEEDRHRACFWLKKAIANGWPIGQVFPRYLGQCKIK